MPTLLLTPRMTDDSIALWRAAGTLGWGVERMRLFRPPDDLEVVDPVLYVEALTAPLFAEALGLTLIEPAVDWLPNLPLEFTRRAVRLMRFSEARELAGTWFIKPPNDKEFPAAIYVDGNLPGGFRDDQRVLVSEVVSWELEFRCFVLDRRVETSSIYLRSGVLQTDAGYECTDEEESEMTAFATRLLADRRVTVPRAVVLDVGRIAGRGWAAVELNAAWGSGIYGCDATRVLEVLRHAAVRSDADVD